MHSTLKSRLASIGARMAGAEETVTFYILPVPGTVTEEDEQAALEEDRRRRPGFQRLRVVIVIPKGGWVDGI